MESKSEYLKKISKRGDAYGGNGGILDLLTWCGKQNTQQVTCEEARRFFEDPHQRYACRQNPDCGGKDHE